MHSKDACNSPTSPARTILGETHIPPRPAALEVPGSTQRGTRLRVAPKGGNKKYDIMEFFNSRDWTFIDLFWKDILTGLVQCPHFITGPDRSSYSITDMNALHDAGEKEFDLKDSR